MLPNGVAPQDNLLAKASRGNIVQHGWVKFCELDWELGHADDLVCAGTDQILWQ